MSLWGQLCVAWEYHERYQTLGLVWNPPSVNSSEGESCYNSYLKVSWNSDEIIFLTDIPGYLTSHDMKGQCAIGSIIGVKRLIYSSFLERWYKGWKYYITNELFQFKYTFLLIGPLYWHWTNPPDDSAVPTIKLL